MALHNGQRLNFNGQSHSCFLPSWHAMLSQMWHSLRLRLVVARGLFGHVTGLWPSRKGNWLLRMCNWFLAAPCASIGAPITSGSFPFPRLVDDHWTDVSMPKNDRKNGTTFPGIEMQKQKNRKTVCHLCWSHFKITTKARLLSFELECTCMHVVTGRNVVNLRVSFCVALCPALS